MNVLGLPTFLQKWYNRYERGCMKQFKEVRAILEANRTRFVAERGVREIGVFGSLVRGQEKAESDIDIFVEFDPGHKTFDNYMELKFLLEELLGSQVDLVIKTAIRDEIRDSVLSEAVYV
jgi:uncharacterized protein